MRYRWRWLAVLAVATACVEPEAARIPLTPPAWQDGEVSVYHITRNDSVLYESRVVLRFDEELKDSDGPGVTGRRAVPTAGVTTRVTAVEAPLFFHDSATVVFRRDSLRPLRSSRSIETDIAVFDIEVRYGADRVEIDRQSIDGLEQQVLGLERNTFDNEQIQTLIRAVPLVSGTRLRVSKVVPMDLRTVPTDIQVLGTKQIETPLGSVTCREVVLSTPAKEVKLWYEIAEPHRFIGMRDLANGTEMLIQSYAPAGSTSEPVAPFDTVPGE